MILKSHTQFRISSDVLISMIIVLSVSVIFRQTGNYGFISFDDGLYVKNNSQLIQGLSLKNIIWAFTTGISGNWHPVTWFSYMLDVELYGINPGMFHMTNVFLHALNSLLLFSIFKNLTGKKWRSGVVAILFAIHPLHVESVAWISERKDVLSTFFAFFSIWFYVQSTKSSKIKNYLLSMLFFTLGLMSKSMVVTIPFVLLLLDFWPLNRFYLVRLQKGKLAHNKIIVFEKIPFLFLTLCMCVVTLYAQQKGNAVATLDLYPAYLRTGNVLTSYVSYLDKIFWPTNLSILYPRPESIILSKTILSFCFLLLITAIAIKNYPQKPYLFTGWCWYLGTLIPVIGIVQIGMQGMADRYMYIPIVGVFVAITWLIFDFCNEKKILMVMCSIVGGIVFLIFASLSHVQTKYWSNSILLYNHSLAVTKNNYVVHRFLGDALMNDQQFKESECEFLKAVKINPKYVAAYNGLGSLSFKKNQYESASHFFHIGLSINPNNEGLLNNLGVTYAKMNDLDSGIKYFKKALKISPDFLDAQKNLKMAENLTKKK